MPRRLTSQDAIAFAKSYTQIVEALMREGVDENTARDEAHLTAMELLHLGGDYAVPLSEACPTCGHFNS